MRERPILFSGPMVRAILAGQKTQTRRAVKMPRKRDSFVMVDRGNGWWPYQSDDGESELCTDGMEHPYSCPYGQPGDRLWVRETWARPVTLDPGPTIYRADYPACVPSYYENVPPADEVVWRPSIHMPRNARRITLEIAGVRVERLQDISEADAFAEGIQRLENHSWSASPARPLGTYRGLDEWSESEGFWTDAISAYAALWESISGAESWGRNPWVWVVEFRRNEGE